MMLIERNRFRGLLVWNSQWYGAFSLTDLVKLTWYKGLTGTNKRVF